MLTTTQNLIFWYSLLGAVVLLILIKVFLGEKISQRFTNLSQGRRSFLLSTTLGLPILYLFLLPYMNGQLKGTSALFSTMSQVFIFAALALTLNLEVGYLGLPNFGKVAFIAISGYSYYFAYDWMIRRTNSMGISIGWGIAIAMIFTGFAGVLLTLPSLRLKEDYFAIVTIVAGEIVRMVLNNEQRFGGASGFSLVNPFFKTFNSDEQIQRVFLDGVSVGVLILYFVLVIARAYWVYTNEKKHKEPDRALQVTIDKSVTFSLILGLLFTLLNMSSRFGVPSVSIDVFVLLTPFAFVLFGSILKIAANIDNKFLIGAGASSVALVVVYELTIFGIDATTKEYPYWYLMLMSYYVLTVIYLALREVITSPFGRTIRAIREDDTSATSVGKSLFVYRLKGLVISSTLTGLAGVIFAFNLFTITPAAYLPIITFNLYIMVIIGGTANNKGVIFGAVLIQLLKVSAGRLLSYKDSFPYYPWTESLPQKIDPNNVAQISIGLLLVIFLIFSPKGIFPEKQQNNQKYMDYLYLLEEDPKKLTGNVLVQNLVKITHVTLPAGDQILEISGSSDEVGHGEAIFDAENINKRFGGVQALNGATVLVQKGRLTSLIGPNGSGKSTFFNVVSGFLENEEDEGRVIFKKKDISNDAPEKISHMGMVRTFQHTRNFPKLSVLENMLVSPQDQVGESIVWSVFGKPLWERQEARYVKRALHILKFLEIGHVANHLADEISGGQQKLLAIGRLLMTQPALLLLDEPVAGVNPTLANKIFDRIVELKESQGIDVLLIEHNMDVVMNFSDEIFVLADGKVIAQGDSKHIQENKTVLDAYLGENPEDA